MAKPKGEQLDANSGLRGLAASVTFYLALHHIAAQRKNFVVGGHIQAAGDVLLADGDREVVGVDLNDHLFRRQRFPANQPGRRG